MSRTGVGSSPSKVALAIEATWDWAYGDTLDKIRNIARKAARDNESLDEDDVFQDLCLAIAVRPEEQTNQAHVIQYARFHVRDLGRTATARARRQVPLDPEA